MKAKQNKLGYASIGPFLKKRRKALGLTQKEVAQKLGYTSDQFIYSFERGMAKPSLAKMKKLAAIYGLSLKDLIEIVLNYERA